jgi:hypothetical protein
MSLRSCSSKIELATETAVGLIERADALRTLAKGDLGEA